MQETVDLDFGFSSNPGRHTALIDAFALVVKVGRVKMLHAWVSPLGPLDSGVQKFGFTNWLAGNVKVVRDVRCGAANGTFVEFGQWKTLETPPGLVDFFQCYNDTLKIFWKFEQMLRDNTVVVVGSPATGKACFRTEWLAFQNI